MKKKWNRKSICFVDGKNDKSTRLDKFARSGCNKISEIRATTKMRQRKISIFPGSAFTKLVEQKKVIAAQTQTIVQLKMVVIEAGIAGLHLTSIA
uniref:Uncharacterized protein n=1 Tax=Strigamia maritima TaxID=126957 RepID=T1JC45_STRMM